MRVPAVVSRWRDAASRMRSPRRATARKLVDVLTPLAKQRFELAESAVRLQIAHAMPPLGKQILDVVRELPLVLGDVPLEFLSRAQHNLGGGRRRRRAQIGDKIRNREIRLVADAGDYREFRDAAIARATISSLNAHKSSSDPPPRATMTTSANRARLK